MTKAEAKNYVASAEVRRHDREDASVWTVDLIGPLGRTVDFEAVDEADARAKAADFLTAEAA